MSEPLTHEHETTREVDGAETPLTIVYTVLPGDTGGPYAPAVAPEIEVLGAYAPGGTSIELDRNARKFYAAEIEEALLAEAAL